jgi:glutamate carboxypeptidase
MKSSEPAAMLPIRNLILAITILLLSIPPVLAQQLDEVERQIIEWVDAHQSDQLEFLEKVVNINSGTLNPEGVAKVGQLYSEAFDALGMDVKWIDLSEVNRAGHLFAETGGTKGKRVLLIGHLDTVFEPDSEFQTWKALTDTTVSGPGTEDMKGGNTVILYALMALKDAGVLDDTQIIVALTGDEEFPGRPISISRKDLIEAAKRSDIALGFEGGVDHMHTATVARRGYTGWEMTVTAKRGHSSLIFSDEYGSGAIFETARILNGWYEHLVGEDNLTFGAGIVVGGTTVSYDSETNTGTAFGKTNVIPQKLVVAGDLRTLSLEQNERAKRRMQEIVDDHLPMTSADLVFDDSYPPMAPTEGNYHLFEMLDQVSQDLGYPALEMIEPERRGAADISFVAPYVDGLAGLGPVGGGGHTPKEFIDIRSMPVTTKRAAVLIYRLTRDSGD